MIMKKEDVYILIKNDSDENEAVRGELIEIGYVTAQTETKPTSKVNLQGKPTSMMQFLSHVTLFTVIYQNKFITCTASHVMPQYLSLGNAAKKFKEDLQLDQVVFLNHLNEKIILD